MSDFPRLKTLAVMQYPAEKNIVFATRVLRFVDGSEQRFRQHTRPLRKWTVRLDLLDMRETAEMETFFQSMSGRSGSFTFIDPWDSVSHNDCSFESDTVRIEVLGEQAAQLTLMIRENLT